MRKNATRRQKERGGLVQGVWKAFSPPLRFVLESFFFLVLAATTVRVRLIGTKPIVQEEGETKERTYV